MTRVVWALCFASVASVASVAAPARAAGPTPADRNALALVTGLVVNALASEPSLEVIASEDVRKQLELEAGRQLTGCAEGAPSCLAEIAGALGARLVVYGTVGQLGDSVVLNLNLFDSTEATAVGRAVVREASIDAVASGVAPAVRGMVAAFIAAHPTDASVDGARTKVLVLDLEGSLAQPATAAPAENALLVPGIAVAVVGGVLAVGGAALLTVSGLAHNDATNASTVQKDVPALYDRRDLTGWLGSGAVALGVVGLGAGIGLVVMGAE